MKVTSTAHASMAKMVAVAVTVMVQVSMYHAISDGGCLAGIDNHEHYRNTLQLHRTHQDHTVQLRVCTHNNRVVALLRPYILSIQLQNVYRNGMMYY
ncbi:MAG: hypothetical protein RI947_262 [Candidatus Parcubacteria bacterium]|jgi:hypothetical protein